MDRLWVKLTAPPRKNWLLYSSRNWGGQRSPGGGEGNSCSLQSTPGQGAGEHLVTIYCFPSLFCPLLRLAVSGNGVYCFSKMAFLLLFTLGVGGGDPQIILTDQRSRKSSFKLLLWLKKHARLLPLDIIKSTCSVLVYA